jgi:hypothetical protein
MSHLFVLNRVKPITRRSVIVFMAILFLIFSAASTVNAMTTRYFADAGADSDTTSTCEVLNWNATAGVCSTRDAYVLASNTANVPKGLTTLRIYFTGVSAATTGLNFQIEGGSFCPGTFGADTGNPNGRDKLANGYYANNPSKLDAGGTVVTDFLLINSGGGAYRNLTNEYGALGKYRAGDNFCKLSGAYITTNIAVSAAELRNQPGLPATTKFVELVAQPRPTNPNDAPNYSAGGIFVSNGCSPAAVGKCDGMINEFRVLNNLSANRSYVTTSSAYSSGANYNVTIQNGDPNIDSKDHDAPGRHQSYIARFGPDCTVPTTGKDVQINLYDIDHGNNPPYNHNGSTYADQIRAQIIRTDTTTGQKYMLDSTYWSTVTATKDAGTVANGNWKTTNKSVPSYADGITVGPAGETYRYLTFQAKPNDKYEFYLMDVRSDLVNQFGLPFDGIYYAIKCQKASVAPVAKVVDSSGNVPTNFEEGDSYTALGSLANSAITDGSASSEWRVWYDDDNGQQFDGVGDTVIYNPSIVKTVSVPASSTVAADPAKPVGVGGVVSSHKYICSQVYNVNPADIMTNVAGAPAQDTKCVPIQRSPYFQVMNGDANAAASLTAATGCTTNTTSPISAFNRGSPSYVGSGAGVAAFAAGAITGFTSGIKQKGLTFANTAGSGDSTYGGGFQGTYCIPDYWGSAAATNATVDASTGTLVTNGDVYITGSPNTLGASLGLGNISLRWIIANNIYINSGVTYLEGNYIAKNKIYTCATGINAPVPIPSLAGSCGLPLTVYGTFIAGTGIKLQRTTGSLNSSPAETFVYSPDIWIQAISPNGNVPTSAQGTAGKYDSITLLPPVL